MARKKRYTENIGTSVTVEVRKVIQKLCEDKETSISEWIREAIELKLRQEPDLDSIWDE